MEAYVEGKEGSAFNIEVQKADDCNHVKRVRYNASVITAHNSQLGATFDNIQKLCMVYISKKDFFGNGRNIYHAQVTIAETGDLVDNGLTEIYVNAEVKDGSRVSALMDVFNKKELSDADKKEFSNIYAKFNSLKHDKEEMSKMCDKIQQYADKQKIYTMIGLLQAVNIEKGYIPVEKISNLPAETYRVPKSFEEANPFFVSPKEKCVM